MILEIFFWYHMVSLESNAEGDADDGVINGNRMAGHVKTCRDWDQLFMEWAFSQGTLLYSNYSTTSFGDLPFEDYLVKIMSNYYWLIHILFSINYMYKLKLNRN